MAKGLYLGDTKKQNPVSHQGGTNLGDTKKQNPVSNWGGTNLGLQDYEAIDT